MKTRTRLLAAVMGLSVTLAGCGTVVASTDDQAATTTTVTKAVGTTATTTATVDDGSSATVSANTATVDEIAAALNAAGVDNADKWAREVVEYRPYDSNDPDLSHLRDELAKYNPGPGVVDLIVSALEP